MLQELINQISQASWHDWMTIASAFAGTASGIALTYTLHKQVRETKKLYDSYDTTLEKYIIEGDSSLQKIKAIDFGTSEAKDAREQEIRETIDRMEKILAEINGHKLARKRRARWWSKFILEHARIVFGAHPYEDKAPSLSPYDHAMWELARKEFKKTGTGNV